MMVASEKNTCTKKNFDFKVESYAPPRIISDHLGSVRVTLTEAGSVDSWSDYYPFGKESRSSASSNKPKEQFTGKERDAESGLDYFGARYYNSEIARWVVVDPLHQYASGYVYVGNNPITLVDPTGLSSTGCAAIDEFDKKVAATESGGVYSPQGGGGNEGDSQNDERVY